VDITIIPLANLAVAFVPVLLVIGVMFAWSLQAGDGLIAIARMLLQLLLIGYLLNWVFAAESSVVVLSVLSLMMLIASWIALRPLTSSGAADFVRVVIALGTCGCMTLMLITSLVLQVEPWYAPRQIIPLGGMIFASAMNTISIAAERFESEFSRGTALQEARRLAYQAALIPLLNSLLAVGLVSLPGMMTGQILAGVEPLIAARYQIVVMCMLTGASGLSAALYLLLAARHKITNQWL